jgi:hypothetical protein
MPAVQDACNWTLLPAIIGKARQGLLLRSLACSDLSLQAGEDGPHAAQAQGGDHLFEAHVHVEVVVDLEDRLRGFTVEARSEDAGIASHCWRFRRRVEKHPDPPVLQAGGEEERGLAFVHLLEAVAIRCEVGGERRKTLGEVEESFDSKVLG